MNIHVGMGKFFACYTHAQIIENKMFVIVMQQCQYVRYLKKKENVTRYSRQN